MAYCTKRPPVYLAFHLKAVDGGYNLDQLDEEVKAVDPNGSMQRTNEDFVLTLFGKRYSLLVGCVLVVERGVGRLFSQGAFEEHYEMVSEGVSAGSGEKGAGGKSNKVSKGSGS